MEPVRERLKLGEILIRQKILTPHLVKRIVDIAHATQRRFGQTLEDMGLVTGEELAQALAFQFDYKIVSGLDTMTVPPGTLGLVTVEQAVEYRYYPLQVRGEKLALAMADPTNYDNITSLATRLNLQIVPFIATTREIMKAIARSYLGIALEEVKDSILVVDTDTRERTALAATLTREGFHTLEAVDPEDGLQQALLHQPSLIITAMEMPFSDGFTFFTTLQGVAETRRIPVILLSRKPSTEEEATAFKRGFFDYISLPARDITLATRVGRALAAGKAYTPHRRNQAGVELSVTTDYQPLFPHPEDVAIIDKHAPTMP